MKDHFVNCTPHTIVLRDTLGNDLSIPPTADCLLRISHPRADDVHVFGVFPTKVVKAPHQQDIRDLNKKIRKIIKANPLCAVLVASIILDFVDLDLLGDVYAPDTSQAIRDDQGRIVAVTGLVRK